MRAGMTLRGTEKETAALPHMTMFTKTLLSIALCSMCMLPLRAVADPPHVPPGQLYRSLESGSSHPAGTIHGSIESIDYSSGVVVVRTGNRAEIVAITPSTSIYGGGGGYAGLSDLRRGQNVDISVYEVGGRLVAQSIRVK